jgi:hypothetical protein
MNELSEHGPVPDPALGDPAPTDDEAPAAAERSREAGTDPARGETDERRDS